MLGMTLDDAAIDAVLLRASIASSEGDQREAVDQLLSAAMLYPSSTVIRDALAHHMELYGKLGRAPLSTGHGCSGGPPGSKTDWRNDGLVEVFSQSTLSRSGHTRTQNVLSRVGIGLVLISVFLAGALFFAAYNGWDTASVAAVTKSGASSGDGDVSKASAAKIKRAEEAEMRAHARMLAAEEARILAELEAVRERDNNRVSTATTEPHSKTAAGARGRIVTVLLVMEPSSHGMRRGGPKVADPVLCSLDGCFISSGADGAAHFLPAKRALGLANTLGGRAGACRQQLGCIFRGVELKENLDYLQPVDLHILKHDLRRGQVITADSDCRLNRGRLSCSRGIFAEGYTMWVVPEGIAIKAGSSLLDQTLNDLLEAKKMIH